ncbi:hypothetical protein KIH27_08645 [Mycobacterium sp. M1]|uniref:Forkhead-associated protein n=1 Tax=Mycolicibacter acidiphilus TaxID=2835306 RepID=A0ABS5RI14_9MYCO|nr:hypothetical protein [Mycolicibacter acidiphilus]MBS9533652.1 hypothetical protein [Mycolicibacter acidiphilus]
MYGSAIDELPDTDDAEFGERVGIILAGLRKLHRSLTHAARRSRTAPSVAVALSEIRICYDTLMARAAATPSGTLGQRLYTARTRAKLTTKEAANGVGLRADLIEAVEVDESVSDTDAAKIKDLIAALGG